MALLHPIILDKYMIYFDNLICVRIDPCNSRMIELVYKDAQSLMLDREIYWDDLASKIPLGLIWYPYNSMWINDFYICHLERIWDKKRRVFYVGTRVSQIGEIREYNIDNFEELLNSRYDLSVSSTISERQETQDLINSLLDQGLNELDLNLPDMGIYFNEQLNKEN